MSSENTKTNFICSQCGNELLERVNIFYCSKCHKEICKVDDIPIFTSDKYWGKVPEKNLINTIEEIDKNGFDSFDLNQQKNFDFTFHEDRADWRFYIPLNEDSTVLDIGAGLGRISVPLARICKSVVACDKSISRMRFLKRRLQYQNISNITPIVGDIFELPFKEKSFDLIVMNGVLEWVGETEQFSDPMQAQIKSLEICRKLLKKDGYLYIGIENRYALAYLRADDHNGLRFTSFMTRWLASFYSKLRGRGKYRTYTYSKVGYQRIIARSGFLGTVNFYLVYPGYNLPRIIIPYENMAGIGFLVNNYVRNKNILLKLVQSIFKFNILIKVYRLFFYSFGIIIKND
jgi:ubiquinone/menaquinone biosynthesis C-methylase UbiE